MEYLIEGLINRNSKIKCHKFIEKNKKVIEDVMLMNKPNLKPLFNIKNIKELKPEIIKHINSEIVKNVVKNNKMDKANELMYWRYYCSCFPNKKLMVLINGELNKNDKKNCLYNFEKKVSPNALKNIELQIKFSQLPFNDFIQYLFDNIERFKEYKLQEYKPREMSERISVYVMDKVEGSYDAFYESDDFYDLVEGSKIFLHFNNYQFYEEQFGFCYGNDLEGSIRTFFRLKFLKMFVYQNYSLLAGEFLMVGGSFFLFAMGFRASRDIDIYILYKKEIDEIEKNNMDCKFDIQDVFTFTEKILNPECYCFYFGFKGRLIKQEIKEREFRHKKLKSRKALADLYILNYFCGKKMDIKNKDRLLQFRYKKIV